MHQFLLRTMTALGLVCLLLGISRPWFVVPTASGSAATDGSFAYPKILGCESQLTPVFQVATAALLMLVVLAWWRRSRQSHVDVRVASVGLVLLLLFPHVQMIWEPATTAHAAWLQVQHENLTWLGGDIFRGHEYKELPAQMRLYVSDSPRQVAVMQLPTWSIGEIGLHRLSSLVEWLGYTNTFCQFVASGWSLSVLGLALLLLATLFEDCQLSVARARTSVHTLLLASLVGYAAAWSWPLAASYKLQTAANYTHRGDHVGAVNQLEAAARLWPPLRQDTWFVSQLGISEWRLCRSSLTAQLHSARILEREKQFDRAIATYREVAAAADARSPLRREACRGLLRDAIRALNSGNVRHAVAGLNDVLRLEPCNIKALYAQQLAYAQLHDIAAVVRAYTQLESIYEYLRLPNKVVVLRTTEEIMSSVNGIRSS